MRELYLVESLVHIIYLPFSYGDFQLQTVNQSHIIVKVCKNAYNLIKLIGRGYYQNELYVSQWINLYFNHAMSTNHVNNIGAEDCIISLVDNNKKLLEVQITPAIIEKIVNLCKVQNRDKQLITLLRAICSCNGEPIVNNQNDITKIMLINDHSRAFLMMPCRMKTDGTTDVLITTDQNGKGIWVPLSSYRKFKKETYGYFLSLIELSAELCLGRNELATKQLQEMFNFDTVKLVIENVQLPFEMRSLFMRILLYTHMDQGLEPLQIPQQTGVWNELPQYAKGPDDDDIKYQIKQSKIQVPSTLIVLKKFVMNYLIDTNGVQDVYAISKNMMTYEILKIIKFMLHHGFYANLDELRNIAIPMTNLLNGANDNYHDESSSNSLSEFISVKRYFSSGDNDIIIQCKNIICQNLLLISQLEVDGKAQMFLSKFKTDLDIMLLTKQLQVPGSSEEPQEESNDQQQAEQKPSFFNRLFNKKSETQTKTKEKTNVENENVQFLEKIALMKNFESRNTDVYICVLFDLLLYKYPVLSKGVFELLVRLFARKRIILESLQSIQMLENPRSIQVLGRVKEYYAEMKKNMEDANTWLNNVTPMSQKIKQRATQIFLFFAEICKQGKKRKHDEQEDDVQQDEGAQLQAGDFDVQQNQSFTKSQLDVTQDSPDKGATKRIKLKQKSKVNQKDFILFQIDEKQASNKENQRLLGSFNIENMALFFIKYRVDRNSINDPAYAQLIRSCYQFLVMYVKSNLTNQIKVHNNIEVYLREIDKDPLICLLIYEIFKDNKRFLTLNVSKILRQIILSAEEASLQSSKKALYLKLLFVFCKFENKLVRQNQQEIVIQFTNDISKNNLIFLFSSEGNPHLINLVQECIPEKFQKEYVVDANTGKKKTGGQRDNQILTDEFVQKEQQEINMSIEIFNVIMCLKLLSLTCEGKSDLAEIKCQNEIMNLQTVLSLYQQCGMYWPIKAALIEYVTHCYLDSASTQLFSPNQNPQNLADLKELFKEMSKDMTIIFDMWNKPDIDVKIIMPDNTISNFIKESRLVALEQVPFFFNALLRNRNIDLGVNMAPVYSEIIVKIAKLYYDTESKALKANAMMILSYINNSDKHAMLLDNVQHPANQNLYVQSKKVGGNKNNLDEQGQKSSQLTLKLIQLANSDDMIQKKEREFEELVVWVTNIDIRISYIMAHHAQVSGDQDFLVQSFENVSYSPIICSFMTLLDSKCLSKDLHITGLTLLRKIIEVENKEMMTPAADWEGDEWFDYGEVIEAKQNDLVDIGCVDFLCKHIQEVDDEEILEQAFLVCITLLLGGNIKSQAAFYEFFRHQDPTNIFMQKLRGMLMEQFDLTKKFISEKNAKLGMVYKFNQQKKKSQEQGNQNKGLQGQTDKTETKGGLAGIWGGLIKDEEEPVIEEEDDEGPKDSKEEEIEDDLLSMDHSLEEEKTESSNTPDEMFLVNKMKSQYMTRTMRLLRFIQLLCEGHHSDLQDFLREQKHPNGVPNQKSFDFVAYVSQMLAIYEKQYINCYSCSLGMQLIDTLIELVQGPCKMNQRRLVDSKIIDCCRDLIQQGQQSAVELEQKGFVTHMKMELHESLKMMSIKLLLSIIDGSVDENVYKLIADSLDDFLILQLRLEQIYEQFVTEELGLPVAATQAQINSSLQKDSFKGQVTEGFNIFILINQLANVLPEVSQKIESFTNSNIYQFFMKNSGNVEVFKDNEIITVYFPVHTITSFLTPQTILNFKMGVNRVSNTHKILGLVAMTPSFIDEMEHQEMRSHDMIKITPDRLDYLRDFSTLIAVMISAIVIWFYKYDYVTIEDGSKNFQPVISPGAKTMMTYLGYGQLGTSMALLIGFCVNRISIILKSGWRKKQIENKITLKNDVRFILNPLHPPFGGLNVDDLPLPAVRTLLLTEGPEHPAFYKNGKRSFKFAAVEFEYKWICLSFLMQNPDFIFSLTYMAFSFQGLVQSPIFYSCHLADMINRFPPLQSVVASVTVNGKSLMMTAMLGGIIIYIYSVFAFIFIADTFYDDDIHAGLLNRKGDSICMTMMHCFLSTINYGLRAGGGIGEFLPTQTSVPENAQGWYFKSIFDWTYFLQVKTILLNIIFGIIIDTFAELREKNKQRMADIQNVCFICHIDRQVFDRETIEGFNDHIEKDHNQWQYLNFIIHLKSIPSTELNGTESYILDLLNNEDISWFPMQKSQKLINNQRQKQTQKLSKLAQLDGQELIMISDYQKKIPDAITSIEEKIRDIEKKL